MPGTEADDGVAAFLSMLDLERLTEAETGSGPTAGATFRPTYYPDAGPITFVFGGQLLAQSLMAAAATIADDRLPDSIHAHFLRSGTPDQPYSLSVVPVRDGGSFSHRRVEVGHDDQPFFVATVSYARPRDQGADGRTLAEYQLPMAPGAGRPGHEGPWQLQRPFASPWAAFKILEFDVPAPGADGLRPFSRRLWLRMHEAFPSDDRIRSAAAIAFASDLGLIVAASVTEGTADRVELSTSLDHALWLHRTSDLHTWHLVDMVSVSNSGGRSLVRASFHTESGDLVASAAQEVLIR